MAHAGGAHGGDAWHPELSRLIDEQPEPPDLAPAIASLADVGVDVVAVQDAVDQYLNLAPANWHADDWRHSHPEFPAKYAGVAHIYTLQRPNVYEALGAAMHGVNRGIGAGGVSPEMRACLPVIKLLDVALVEAAIVWGFFVGQTLRGVKYAYPRPTVAEHNPESHFPKDREFPWYEFNSSSTDHAVMERPWFCGLTGPRTIFTIQSVEGVSVKRFSAMPDEEEVLFRPLARFKVTGCTKMLTAAALAPGAHGHADTVQLQQLPTFSPQDRLRGLDQLRARADAAEQARLAAEQAAEQQRHAAEQATIDHMVFLLRSLGIPEGVPDLQQEPEPELEPQPRDGQLTDLEEVQQQLEHQLSGLRSHRDWSASKMQMARMIPHLDPPLNGRPVAIVNEYQERFGMVWALGSSGTTEAPIILCDRDDMDDRGCRWRLISDEDPDADPGTYAIEYQFDGNGQRGMRLGFHDQWLKLFQPRRLTDQGCRWKVVPSGNGKYSIENMHSECTGMRIGMSSRNVKMFPQSQMNDGGQRWALEYSPN